jgi:hypothetical protein
MKKLFNFILKRKNERIKNLTKETRHSVKFLHICPLLGFTIKYANDVNSFFQSKDHVFIFYGANNQHPLKFTTALNKNSNCFFINGNQSYDEEMIHLIHKYSPQCNKIFLHSLNCRTAVNFLFENQHYLNKCYWLLWGFGLYYDMDKVNFGEPTFDVEKHASKLRVLMHHMGGIITHIDEDCKLAQKKFGFHGKFFHVLMYHMFDSLDIFVPYKDRYNNRTINIVVGHAADINCNQIRTLNMLSSLKNENIKIFCPLSYGPKNLSEAIINTGKQIFKDKFEAITEIMKLDEYDNFLSRMDIGIYDQKRQKGVTNIFKMISLGKKVYLNNYTTTFKSLEHFGFKIYAINSKDFNSVLDPMPDEKCLLNHKNFMTLFNKKSYLYQWKEILSYKLNE